MKKFVEYLKCRTAYAIMPIGKTTELLIEYAKIPEGCDLRGFSIPFGKGGLYPRLAAGYSSPSSHLQT